MEGCRHTVTSTRIVIIINHRGVTNRSPPIWEIGDVVIVLEEWEISLAK
jgi:hypothetical protein